MKELILNDLNKHYGTKGILDSVSVKYRSGLIHGVIGNNGAGKTTLMNCIAGYENFTGNIEFQNILSTGYLQAELYMFSRITGREFLFFCINAKKQDIDTQEINTLNELFELPLDKYAENYSSGMLKKLHLMSLILQKNDLLLLDEPFNGLDISSTAFMTELFKTLKKKDIIILISSHALHHLIDFCDTLSYVDNRKLNFIADVKDFDKIVNYIENQSVTKIKESKYFRNT
jgi:ABC-2 type transport system ATP-binding protein